MLYYPDGTTRLAPFYDLVCTQAIEGLDSGVAFAVGGEYEPDAITLSHWGQLAEECGVSPKRAQSLVASMARALQTQLTPTLQFFEARYGADPSLQRIAHVVQSQCSPLDQQRRHKEPRNSPFRRPVQQREQPGALVASPSSTTLE